MKEITQCWTEEITKILKTRYDKKVETEFTISDLLRAKCLFSSVKDIERAVQVADNYCKEMGYEIMEAESRLHSHITLDYVLKIRIRDAVCEFQLAINQDQTRFHFDHSLYEILRSPLGVIFGSYLFMSK